LIRLAVVVFQPKLSKQPDWALEQDGIEVVPLRVWDDEDDHTQILVSASQVLDYRPKVTADNEVVVPDRQRAAAEGAIEVAAGLIAVSQVAAARSPRRRRLSCSRPSATTGAPGWMSGPGSSTTR
jgi:hypothetical protein